MIRSLVTAPSIEPVSIQDAKHHLRVDGNDEDEYITVLIKAAREHVENMINRALISQTWAFYLPYFTDEIKLSKSPLQSVTSISYQDSDNATQALASSVYDVDTVSLPGRVLLANGQSWPSTYDVYNAITITAVMGFGDFKEDVPEAIRQAIMIYVAHLYEHRELSLVGTSLTEIPMSINSLLSSYKVTFIQ